MNEVKRASRFRNARGWLFVLPGLLFHIFAVAIPAVLSLYLPFTEWNGLSMPKFNGLDNFKQLIHDSIVGTAFLNNIKWALFWVTVPTIFAFFLAYLLNKIKRWQTVYQSIYFSTSIITVTVAGQIWLWLYNPFSGMNFYLDKAGVGFIDIPGLTIPSLSIFFVLIADMWKGFGGNVVWLLAAMTQNDKSLEEAAKLDGAGRFRIIWNVILPQLRPTLVIVTMLTVLNSFGAFEMVYVMTGGGPAHATETLSTYYYVLSTTGRQAGYGSMVALLQTFIAVVLIGAYGYLRKKKGWDV